MKSSFHPHARIALGLAILGLSACSKPRNVEFVPPAAEGRDPIDAADSAIAGGSPDAGPSDTTPADVAASASAETAAPAAPEREKSPGGATCAGNGDCTSGVCAHGICCAKACGVCESCGGPGGACQLEPAGEPDARCPAGHSCDGRGQCVASNGSPCGTGRECLSGFCVDAVCCQRACGTCETCAAEGTAGTCTALTNATDPGTCEAPDRICTTGGVCGQIDQRQDMHVAATSGLTKTIGVAQGIKVGRTGVLVGVRVRAHCDPGATLTVTVRMVTAAGPTGATVAAGSLAADKMLAALPRGETGPPSRLPRQLLLLNPQLPVPAGMQLALIFNGPGCRINNYGFYEDKDPYPAGDLFWTSQTQPGAWTYALGDLCFETVLGP